MYFAYLVIPLLASFNTYVECARILAICNLPNYSHFRLTQQLVNVLTTKKHEVTFINTFEHNTTDKKYTNIFVRDPLEYSEDVKKRISRLASAGPIGNSLQEFNVGLTMTELFLNSEPVQKLLKSNQIFDLIIIEHFCNEALLGFGSHFKSPVVILSPIGASIRSNFITGNPAPSSYVPNQLSSFTKNMNLWQRMGNFLANTIIAVLREFSYLPEQRNLYRKYFSAQHELDTLLHNVSLILHNSYTSLLYGIPQLPKHVNIAGYHISAPKKLPEDLQKFLDEARDGAILFSMGTVLRSADLKPCLRRIILNTLSKLKQRVIWKFESELENVPINVKILKWLPQQDLLVHPNLKAFITHGGSSSTMEALYFGVPVIGIPVFADQKHNIAKVVANGYGVGIPLIDLTEEGLLRAIKEVLNNSKYKATVRKQSKSMRDQPLKSADLAVFCIEQVLRRRKLSTDFYSNSGMKWYHNEMGIVIVVSIILILLLTCCHMVVRKTLSSLDKKK